ncbi:hypothetical protein [Arthrobacter sp. Edens01]|uniref:hypothetical protein n=1 Tax=Arthrobacter sp. Edens01 TaxID=1732020 RepID=UPI000AC8988E|nr:hypothetical protein [Arthrobacter sp. Edens01]
MTELSAWRERVLTRNRKKLDSEIEPSEELDSVGWDRLERSQWLEAAQSFDPTASLREELLLRLVGSTATSSGLRLEWEGLLKPLQEAIAAGTDETAMELAGFSRGSSVLHFRAVRKAPVERLGGDSGAVLHETPLAAPARKLIEIVSAVEDERDIRKWSASTQFEGLERLVEQLRRLELEAEFRYYARSGDVRAARLSERGMGYIDALSQPEESHDTVSISGRVTELRQSGHAKVKAGPNRNATAYDVQFDTSQLTGMRLVLGQSVHWEVRTVSVKDKLGRLQSLRYEFERDLGLSVQQEIDPKGSNR